LDGELLSIWDIEGLNLLFYNDKYAREFGEKATRGMNFFDTARLILKDKPDKSFLNNILEDLKKDGSQSYKLIFLSHSGREFMGKLNLVIFEHGGKKFILQRIIDINELNDAINSINQEKQKFEALFQFASMAIIVANKQGKIVLANVFARNLFGYGDEMIGEKVEILIPRRFHNNHEKHREGYNHHPTNRSMGEGLNLSGARKDGSEFPVEVSLGHYSIDQDTFSIAFIIDISRRRETEETMLNQRNELEKINQEIEQMNDELEEKVARRTFE
jgi:PAS domain S-box-containing protein